MNTPATKSPKLISVQILRAFGVSAIICAHIGIAIFNTAFVGTDINPGWTNYLYGCRSTIDMFFVFSGFIMVYIAHAGFAKNGTVAQFLIFRLSRIVPIYWGYTGLAVFLTFLLQQSPVLEGTGFQYLSWEAIWKSLLFIPYENNMLPVENVDGITIYPLLVVGWTLNYEIQFYLLFALCMLFRMRTGLILLTCIIALLSVGHKFCPPDYLELYFWTSPILWKFIIGAWVGYFYVNGIRFPNIPPSVVTVVCLLAFGIMFGMYSNNIHPDTIGFHAATSVLCAIIAVGMVLTRLEHLKAPDWVVQIGDASYSTYLSHIFIVIAAYAILYMAGSPSVPEAVCVGAIVYALSLYIGNVSYQKLELPIMNFFRSLYKKKQQA